MCPSGSLNSADQPPGASETGVTISTPASASEATVASIPPLARPKTTWGGGAARSVARKEDELDVAGQASLEVAVLEIGDLEREAESLRVEAVGAVKVRDHEDDGEVLDLSVQHGFFSYASDRVAWDAPEVAVRGPGVSTSVKNNSVAVGITGTKDARTRARIEPGREPGKHSDLAAAKVDESGVRAGRATVGRARERSPECLKSLSERGVSQTEHGAEFRFLEAREQEKERGSEDGRQRRQGRPLRHVARASDSKAAPCSFTLDASRARRRRALRARKAACCRAAA